MKTVLIVARHTFRECLRRKVFIVVPIATLAFVALYALGNHYAFRSASRFGGRSIINSVVLTGGSLVGLSMFMTLFMASALGIFLTFSTIRGDAEQGILQPMVVRPTARWGLLAGRFVGAVAICGSYALFLYLVSVAITRYVGGWSPDPMLVPGLELVAAVCIVIALSLLGSVYLSALTNGIGMFMLYGAGLLAGLLGQLGGVLASPALATTGRVSSYLLPFEALYQSALHSLTAGSYGFTRVVIQLGPLGGAQEGGPLLGLWAAAYLAAVIAITLRAFARRDL